MGCTSRCCWYFPKNLFTRSLCSSPRGYVLCCHNSFLQLQLWNLPMGTWSCPIIYVPVLPAANSSTPLPQGRTNSVVQFTLQSSPRNEAEDGLHLTSRPSWASSPTPSRSPGPQDPPERPPRSHSLAHGTHGLYLCF